MGYFIIIIRSSSGVFIVPFENEFGRDRSTISFAFAKERIVVKENESSLAN
ncbi:hypothetical protein [Bacillus coreaensis]